MKGPTAMRKLYDSTVAADIPGNATFIAAYANGKYANVTEVRQRFPHATILTVDVTGNEETADILDYETGDVHDIASAASWVRAKHAWRPSSMPTIYSDLADFPLLTSGLAHYGLVLGRDWWSWIADPGASPAKFESVPGVVGVQDLWAGTYDSSDVWVARWHPSAPAVPPVSCVVTWAGADGLVSRRTLIPRSVWDALKWSPAN